MSTMDNPLSLSKIYFHSLWMGGNMYPSNSLGCEEIVSVEAHGKQ